LILCSNNFRQISFVLSRPPAGIPYGDDVASR
jgi:hypothetical protein